MVIAAEQYASRLVIPSSQQHSPMRWPSHKDHARKALAKLAGPHLPVTLKQVERAVAKAHAPAKASGGTSTSRDAGGVDERPVAGRADADALDDELDGDQRPDERRRPGARRRVGGRRGPYVVEVDPG